MRTTLTLDDDIHARVVAMARSSGRRLGEVVSELLRQRLDAGPQAARISEDGFDLVTYQATGKKVFSSDVTRLLEEEGISE